MDRKTINKINRANRMREARKKGTHTKREWEHLKFICNYTCVICDGASELVNVEKDHIVPVYQGGSDSIENLQPACALCNASKGPDSTDMRPADWKERLNALLSA